MSKPGANDAGCEGAGSTLYADSKKGPAGGENMEKKIEPCVFGIDQLQHIHNVHTSTAMGADLLGAAVAPDGEAPETAPAPLPAELAMAAQVIEAALGAGDPTEMFSEAFVEACRTLRSAKDQRHWLGVKARLQGAKPKGVTMLDINRATRPEQGEADGSAADALVDLALSMAELFHGPDGTCYARLREAPHLTSNIAGDEWQDWLAFQHYQRSKQATGQGRAASPQALKTAAITIAGIAKHEGPERPAFLRAARDGDTYYLDMGDPACRVIAITAGRWQIVQDAPVVFWRTAMTKALPTPLPPGAGDITRLWRYANIGEADRPLLLAWMLDAWRPDTPFPVCELAGMHGSAKSSTQSFIRDFTDPSALNLRTAPKSVEDLFVSANLNWCTSLNNLSHLGGGFQDAICCLATGGGYSARTLFTNLGETAFEAKRPVIFNSITPVATAQDLSDRLLHFELPTIDRYLSESNLKAGFTADAPAILGGLLDLFAATLAALPAVTLARPPRMADFALLGEAMLRAQGEAPGTFLELYRANRQESIARGLEASPVAAALRSLVDAQDPRPVDGVVHNGTMGLLLTKLEEHRTGRNDAWPKFARGLGGRCQGRCRVS